MAGAETETLTQLGEDALVARLAGTLPRDGSIVVGAGDDCAVVETSDGSWQLFKTDCIVEGIHFVPGTKPEAVGRKAMNRAISDVAAMGGQPRHAVVTLAVDRTREVEEIEGWYRGLNEAAAASGCLIVGGETTSLNEPGALISVAMTGELDRENCVTRSGARVGDVIAVTGRLGGSFESGRHLEFEPRLEESTWLVQNFRPTSMMDLSDGLGADLPRLVSMSGVGYEVNLETVPCHDGVSVERAIAEGEDYELLMTVAGEQWSDLLAAWEQHFPGTELSAIGAVVEETRKTLPSGWEHFKMNE